MTFYHDTFGGELQLYSFADFNRTDGPADAVAHSMITGPVALSGADIAGDEQPFAMTGAMLSILGEDVELLTGWFESLSDGGTVVMPIEKRPWGDHDGQVIDRFGVHWLIGHV